MEREVSRKKFEVDISQQKITGKKIASTILKMMCYCRALALIVNTTLDVSKHEFLSICIKVVSRTGACLRTSVL